jgi:threonine/homoserine/homoserine lactone efflux protein
VNVVELICSAGIPAVYTQVLVQSHLPAWQYYGYLMLYIAVFMLDDLVVLVATLGALEVAGLTTRYTRWSNLIGGVVLLALGLLLVFRPAWLSFG